MYSFVLNLTKIILKLLFLNSLLVIFNLILFKKSILWTWKFVELNLYCCLPFLILLLLSTILLRFSGTIFFTILTYLFHTRLRKRFVKSHPHMRTTTNFKFWFNPLKKNLCTYEFADPRFYFRLSTNLSFFFVGWARFVKVNFGSEKLFFCYHFHEFWK